MLLSLVLSLVSPAEAFAPSDEGSEPMIPWRYHAPAQARLSHSPDWVEFRAADGAGWMARFDERSGTVHRAWGPGIPMGPIADAAGAEAAVRAFFAEYPGLIGVGADTLQLRSIGEADGSWYLDFARLVDGVPTYRAGVQAVVKLGGLVWFRAETWPGAALGRADVSANDAKRAAMLDGRAPMADHRDVTATLVALPWSGGGRAELRLAWEVRSVTSAPVGRWVTHVDAGTGTVLNSYNEVRSFTGTVTGQVNERTVGDPLESRPMPAIRVSDSNGGTVEADEDGVVSLTGDSGVAVLQSDYFVVQNRGGATGSLTISAGAAEWTTAAATQAEINTYRFLYDVKEWCDDLGVSNDWCSDAFQARVNRGDGTCNAYWDGNVNFYAAGSGCNNTGEISDVVYHEWGHGFHYFGVEAGSTDGSISEGIGDSVAQLLTLDAELAPGFYQDSDSGIRESASNRVYPDDWVNQVHTDGLIFAGAMWDLRYALSDTYGESPNEKGTAWAVTSRLLGEMIRSGPDIPGSFDALMIADDDDGDLANGTPHLCELMEAFGLHGLGPVADGGGLVTLDHTPLDAADPGSPVFVEGAVTNIAPACSDSAVETLAVHYTTDGTAWTSAVGSVAGDNFSAELPAFADGTIVTYYVAATSSDGTEITAPTHGGIAPYTFYVGALEEIACFDFEDDDGGFTHALLDGDEQEGADDWMWEEPSGLSEDPTSAYSGDMVWGNDLGGGRYNGAYQPDIQNRLTSAAIDTAGRDRVIVQYRRWLQVEDGYYDAATVYGNDEVLWTNHASSQAVGDEDTVDDEWMLHTLAVDAPGETLTLAWEITSDSGKEMGGWNIDDVCIYGAERIDWAVVEDFSASDDLVGEVALQWTQPDDSRAMAAIVVRRTDRYAVGKEDGDIVFSGSVTPGSVQTATDPYVGTAYYSVFAGSSDGWSSGAVEGVNADLGAGLTEDEAAEIKDGDALNLSGSVCSCASGSGGWSWLGLGAALLVLRRRRG